MEVGGGEFWSLNLVGNFGLITWGEGNFGLGGNFVHLPQTPYLKDFIKEASDKSRAKKPNNPHSPPTHPPTCMWAPCPLRSPSFASVARKPLFAAHAAWDPQTFSFCSRRALNVMRSSVLFPGVPTSWVLLDLHLVPDLATAGLLCLHHHWGFRLDLEVGITG